MVHNLFSSQNIIKMIKSMRVRWTGHVCTYKKSVKGKRSLARIKCRWQDNIEVDLKEIGWEGIDWIHLGQDREQWSALVNTNELSGSVI
jgi:hypothetical protein